MVTETHSALNPLLPFDSPTKPRKSRKHKSHRITPASALTFEEAKTHRNKAFLLILRLLCEFDSALAEECLTARQMLRLLKSRGLINPSAERNYLSPRLTELLDFECIENLFTLNEGGEETHYLKRVDGDAAASVWRITDKGRELLNALEKLEQEVKK